jgi:hypothetical protein
MIQFKLLLDFDGVLNASKAGWSRAPVTRYVRYNYEFVKVRWEPQVIEKLVVLNSHPAVEVLWATTWVGNTDQLEDLLRLPALRSAAPRSMEWDDKGRAAVDFVRQGYKVIWVDDEAIPGYGPTYDELVAHDALLVRPRSSRGLRPEHFDEIWNYVATRS